MTQTNSFKRTAPRFFLPTLALSLLALANGCVGGGYEASDMLSEPAAAGGQANGESSPGDASTEPSSNDSSPGHTTDAAGGGATDGATNDAQADDTSAVPDASLVGKMVEWLDYDVTIERAETSTAIETNSVGESHVARLHSMTVKVQGREDFDPRGQGWELALADGMRVPPLCVPEPSEPFVVRFHFDFFHESEQPFADACLEPSVTPDGMPARIAFDSFVSADAPSSEH